MMGQLSLEQMEVEQLRQQVADLSARLDAAQVMILEREATIAGQAGRLAERDAKIAELEAKQWDVIAQKFIDLDEHIMATAASVGCDSVASMAREIVKDRARIAELEAAQHEATSFFLTPHGEWLWGDKETPLVERIKAMAFEMDAKIDELEAAQQWTSVGERLPSDEDEGSLTWTNNGSDYKSFNYDIGFHHEKFGWLLSTEWEHGDPTVTHWMPLPPPPTAGT